MGHLPSESLVAYPFALLVAVWLVFVSAFRLRGRLWGRDDDDGELVVPGAERLLLYDSGPRLCDYSFASAHRHSSTDAIPDATTYAAANSTCNTFGPSRSVQLRC